MLILVEIFFLYVETVVLLNVFVETLMHLFWIFWWMKCSKEQ